MLTVTHNYPRFPGDPAGAFVARIAQGTAARGHEVEVLAPHAPGAATGEEAGGVRIRRFRYGPETLERVAYTGGLHARTLASPLAALGFPGFVWAFGHAVRSAIQRFRPEVVHAHWWIPGGWFVSHRPVPYLVTCHGSDVRLLERGKLVRRLARPVFEKAARITTVSNFLAQDLRRLVPGLKVPVVVTPMPVNVQELDATAAVPRADPPRILYAGNLVDSKGVDVLLRAGAELERRGLRWQLKILGDGPARRALEALARELDIAGKVTWGSFVPQSRMGAEYAASTVTALPSRGQAEGLGLTLVEALLAGCAVVGSAAGGIPEVVQHERTGLIAREGDAVHLATQIARLLNDPGLRNQLASAGREHVLRHYSPDAAVGRFLEIYDAVADHQSKP